MLSKHDDDIVLDAKLFARVKAVFDQRATLDLNPEQLRLLEKTTRASSGAVPPWTRTRRPSCVRSTIYAHMGVKFDKNVLKEDNGFSLVLDKAEDLARAATQTSRRTAKTAKAKGQEGKWIFTLHKLSCIPLLPSTRPSAGSRTASGPSSSAATTATRPITKKAVASRSPPCASSGPTCSATSRTPTTLEEAMAEQAGVYGLLDQIWPAALAMAKVEAELEALMAKDGMASQPWDWWYYAEKLEKKAQYDLDDEILRPYFELKAVRRALRHGRQAGA